MIKKYLLLKSMDQIVKSLYNEFNYYHKWCAYIPENATDKYFEIQATDDNAFNEIAKVFIEIIQDDGVNGFYINDVTYGV